LSVTHEIFQPNRESNPPSLPSRDVDKWVLIALAMTLLLTNRWFAFLEDEANAIVVATTPAWHLVSMFLTGDYPRARDFAGFPGLDRGARDGRARCRRSATSLRRVERRRAIPFLFYFAYGVT
jgi:hypothetical protein